MKIKDGLNRDDYYKVFKEHGHRKHGGRQLPENRGAIINKLPTELTVDRFMEIRLDS